MVRVGAISTGRDSYAYHGHAGTRDRNHRTFASRFSRIVERTFIVSRRIEAKFSYEMTRKPVINTGFIGSRSDDLSSILIYTIELCESKMFN